MIGQTYRYALFFDRSRLDKTYKEFQLLLRIDNNINSGGVQVIASDRVDNNFLKEWETARDVLTTFDNRLHELRKYGFSFITVFLTASTILFDEFPENIKFVILTVTLVLILALFLMDRFYQVFIKSSALRARILERMLNIELTEVITERYRYSKARHLVTFMYILFIFGVWLLGRAVLIDELNKLHIGGSLALISLLMISSDELMLQYPYGKIDWMLDRLSCVQGDEVGIIMTNLDSKTFTNETFSPGTVMWQMVEEGSKLPLREGVAIDGFEVEAESNYTWVLKTGKDTRNNEEMLEPGIYRVERITLDKKGSIDLNRKLKIRYRTLNRKLKIIRKPKPSKPKPSTHHVILKEKI